MTFPNENKTQVLKQLLFQNTEKKRVKAVLPLFWKMTVNLTEYQECFESNLSLC